MRLFAPWKWRRKKKTDSSDRKQERRMSKQEDPIQRTVLIPDLKSDFTSKPQNQQLDLCSQPEDPAGGSSTTTAVVGLNRVSPATSHLTGAVATCLVGMGPLLRSSLNGRPENKNTDLRDFSSLQSDVSHQSSYGNETQNSLSTALVARNVSRPVLNHMPSLSERAVLSAISAELQLNFLEAKSRLVLFCLSLTHGANTLSPAFAET
jgi:hypothetical protein